jgi:hypothetical protein
MSLTAPAENAPGTVKGYRSVWNIVKLGES